jgi:hypothetical protein
MKVFEREDIDLIGANWKFLSIKFYWILNIAKKRNPCKNEA